MVRLVASLLIVLAIAGCASVGTNDVVRSPYEGVPVDTFFARWGGPVTSRLLADGGKVYLWYSGRFSAYIPGEDGTADLIGNTEWWRGYSLRDYDTRLECGVRIYTTPDRTIQAILVHESHKGWWEFRKCHRYFGPPVSTPPGPPGQPVIVWSPTGRR